MKYLIFPLVALGLGLGTGAMAQPAPSAPKSYPPCSKSVTDECMGSSHDMMHHAAMRPSHRKISHHRKMAAHHRPHHMTHAAHHAMKARPAPKSS
ncbi:MULTISPECIES: hypothetical protein [unclassified Sphingobium]|uniref:hypothetical protein n=1 Tax=unclassified Sphingobium TaxID=2611147 RepID=UPI00077028C8|nr:MULTISPECIES: hypothetical protein [Sphingomonadaceae]AMK21887.1 hypothetical protein K426_04650 [Sphingobium sp. TKS]NML89627.1 hypothetical protein [Sphingobium sp. TB-6]